MQQEPNTAATPVKRGKVFRFIKWSVLIVGGLFALIIVLAIVDGSNDKKPDSEPNQAIDESVQAPEPFNIVVTSQIVKKVDGKHRYFFDIRNNDTKDFEGSVTIELINQEGRKLGNETFNTNKAISPNLGTSQYIDINTGPVSVHGASGISKFTYEVKVNNQTVRTGEGDISAQYEDL
jgi:hypothetical protein